MKCDKCERDVPIYAKKNLCAECSFFDVSDEVERLKELWHKTLPFEMVPDEIEYLKVQALKEDK